MIWVCVLFFIQQRTFILTRVNQFYYRIRRNQSQLLELDELLLSDDEQLDDELDELLYEDEL